jgi:hypothetical protein
MVGTLEVELAWAFGGRWGKAEEDTARAVVVGGIRDAAEPLLLEATEPFIEPTEFFLDFVTGSEGRGPVGGLSDGRDGRGSVVAMMFPFDG